MPTGALMKKDRASTGRARYLRRQGTDAEKALWYQLRNRRIEGTRFRRQQPIGPYIVDFVSFERRLVVEVDGGQRDEEVIAGRDEERTRWLNGKGYRVVRFWNSDILGNLEGVLESVAEALRGDSGTPSPSPVKGEGMVNGGTNRWPTPPPLLVLWALT